MEATEANILTILGQDSKDVTLEPKKKGNGYILKGLVRRNTLQNLMNNFHPYVGRRGFLCVITPGTLSSIDEETPKEEIVDKIEEVNFLS